MNDSERYLFDLNGFLTVPNALSPEQISALNAQVDEHIEQHAERNADQLAFRHVLDWRGPMLNLIDNPRVVPYLEALFSPTPYKNVDAGPFYRLDHTYITVLRHKAKDAGAWHLHGGGTPFDPGQYYHVQEGRLYNGLIVVAYNLTDVNEGDGGLGVVPGSHKANFRLPHEWHDLRQKNNPLARAVTGKAGTAVFFTEASTHGTLPWNAKHERRTIFFKYNCHCTAFSDNYLDEAFAGWEELTPRQRAVLEAPNCRGKGRKREQAMMMR
jgi:ectoine hydroxylase-related dioxygenase (phytanoyl-CoA dioxygenase family)